MDIVGSSSSSSKGAGGGASAGGVTAVLIRGAASSSICVPDGIPLSPPTPATSRNRRNVVQGGQPPRCQVEGCKMDLSDAKAYYSRHKVCGMHSKTSKVIVAGLEQRFCQQCSRL